MNSLLEFDRLPVVKLPPVYMLDIVKAIASGDASRASAVRKSLGILNRQRAQDIHLDEKGGFRSMISPTLTHLHVARSRPPDFYLAPNGELLSRLNGTNASKAAGLILRDLLSLRLNLDPTVLAGVKTDQLRKNREPPRLVERIQRYIQYLRFYPMDYKPVEGYVTSIPLSKNFKPLRLTDAEARVEAIIRELLNEREVVPLDTVRGAVIKGFVSEERAAISSFSADTLINNVLESGAACLPLTGGGSRIDTGVFRGRPFLGLRRVPSS